jgi:Zn-dependent protease/predicted transcriptional regulator
MPREPQGSGFLIGKIFGIPIFLHSSWFIIFALITLSLRLQFNSLHPSWTPAQHWMIGIVVSVLFFASVIFHELSHSVVARHYNIPVQSITLFVFGGLARITREPDNAKQEVSIAIAGPIASLFLAGFFWLAARYFHGNDIVAAAAGWLWQVNLMLALFNLVPGFPLDGGRILRGIVWGITRNFTRATHVASNAGKAFAYALILFGVWRALNGNWIAGLWLAFIGWFLLSAAQESYMNVAIQSTLSGVRVGDIMTREVPSVPRDISVEQYVHEVVRTGQTCHLVTASGDPVGLVTLSAARSIPREEWPQNSIQAVMAPLSGIRFVSPEEPAIRVLEQMQSEDVNQIPVISGGRVVGMIARDSILRVLQSRLQVRHLAG